MSTADTIPEIPIDSPWYGKLASQVLTRYGLAGIFATAIMVTVCLSAYKLVPNLASAIDAHAKNQVVQTEVLREVKLSLQDIAKYQQQQTTLYESLRRDQAQALQDHREMMASFRSKDK